MCNQGSGNTGEGFPVRTRGEQNSVQVFRYNPFCFHYTHVIEMDSRKKLQVEQISETIPGWEKMVAEISHALTLGRGQRPAACTCTQTTSSVQSGAQTWKDRVGEKSRGWDAEPVGLQPQPHVF